MNQSKIANLAKSLISIKTLPDHQKEISSAVGLLENVLKTDQIGTKIISNGDTKILWATNQDFTNPDLLLLCHVDVVSGAKSLFMPKIQGDKILGRGAFDMKGALCAMVSTITTAPKDKHVQLVVTSDEEIGGGKGAAWFFPHSRLKPKIALIPDGLQANTITLKQKGPSHIVVSVPGKSAHASASWLGDNPVVKFEKIIGRLRAIEPLAQNSRTWRSTITPTQIATQTSINQLASSLTFTIDVRAANPGLISHIKRIIRQEGATIVKQFGDGKIFEQPKNQIIRDWMTITKQVTKKSVKTNFSCGGSDARHLPKSTTSIITQVQGGGAHADTEWVSIQSLMDLSQITSTFINKI